MNNYITILMLSLVAFDLSAQNEKKLVRQGNNQYENKKYSDAEVSYKKALEKQSKSISASYNLGNALYRQEKMQDAVDQYSRLAVEGKLNKQELAMIYYNMGNSYLQAGKIEESIEAYKKSLINNPGDMEAKYNLSFAQHKLHEQQNNDKKDNKEIEPSEYAKKIKAQADELVKQRKYKDASMLMDDLIKKDPSAFAYQDYIKRLKDVVKINSI